MTLTAAHAKKSLGVWKNHDVEVKEREKNRKSELLVFLSVSQQILTISQKANFIPSTTGEEEILFAI